MVGARGISPVRTRLQALRDGDVTLARRLSQAPTLLWLSASDAALRTLAWGGAAAGAAVAGALPPRKCTRGRGLPVRTVGVFPPATAPFAIGCAWVCACCGRGSPPHPPHNAQACMLSLDFGCELTYPWDTVLLEAGALIALLPCGPSWAARGVPDPVHAFAFRLLLWRLMIGFGKIKFTGTNANDRLYIKTFCINMSVLLRKRGRRRVARLLRGLCAARRPVCTPGGYAMAELPPWFHVGALRGMWVSELVVPFLFFVPGPLRVLGGCATAGLMAGIAWSGNYGYFNVLTTVLCIPLLDHASTLLAASGVYGGDAAAGAWWSCWSQGSALVTAFLACVRAYAYAFPVALAPRSIYA